MFSTAVGRGLYCSYIPSKGKLYGIYSDDETFTSALKMDSEVASDKFLRQQTLLYIRNNLNKLPKLELLKFLFFWCPFDWEIISSKGIGVYNYMYGFIFPFFIIPTLLQS